MINSNGMKYRFPWKHYLIKNLCELTDLQGSPEVTVPVHAVLRV